MSKMDDASKLNVPDTNNRTAISYCRGVLEKVVKPFGIYVEETSRLHIRNQETDDLSEIIVRKED